MTVDDKDTVSSEMKAAYQSSDAAVQKVVGGKRDEGSFEVLEPTTRELSKKEFNRVNKG